MLDQLPLDRTLNADPEFRYAARYWNAVIRLWRDDVEYDVTIDNGLVTAYGPAGDGDCDVRIGGAAAAWDGPKALAGNSMLRPNHVPRVRIQGDSVSHVGPYRPAISALIRIVGRGTSRAAEEDAVPDYPFKATDCAVGRYVYYQVAGVEYRVYYEVAGTGVPVMLQHTAGADSRQWRHLLADPALQSAYQMIAYDLPYHGRSLPPLAGDKWWEHDYAPTKDDLLARVVGLKRALGLDRPIFMGTSMGGQLAPELLAHYPDDFRGAVAINGWHHMDAVAGFSNDLFHHPRISSEYQGALMYDATSGAAPEPYRRENAWIYASGGPGIYKGDNEYFISGHDMRGEAHLIDTTRTPLYVVVGEYDPAARAPGGARDLAANVRGARYAELAGVSHFGMSDDPARFNAAIKPILDQVSVDAARSLHRQSTEESQ